MSRMTRKKYEVIKAVVKTVTVNVVDYLGACKRSAEVLFHNVAVFKDSSFFYANNPVAIFSYGSRAGRSFLSLKRVASGLISLVMKLAVSKGFMLLRATFNRTRSVLDGAVSFALSATMPKNSSSVHTAKTFAMVFVITILYGALSHVNEHTIALYFSQGEVL